MSSRLALAMSAAALVVALLGSTPLGHALASQVPRNSVGAAQIKRNAVGPSKVAPNAIRTGHVLDGSLLTTDFKAGQIPQGPKGDKGQKGDKGDVGDPGVSARQVVSANSGSTSSDNLKQARANCPTGKVPIGGGASISGAQVAAITASYANSVLSAWFATAVEFGSSNASWSLSAYVICAKVSP
jgi:hypothetical protein